MVGTHNASGGGPSNLEALTLLGIFSLARRNKWLLALPIILCTGTAVALALYLPEVFEAHALLDLELPESASPYDPRMSSAQQLASVRDTINRRSFLEPIIEEYDLYETVGGRVSERDLEDMRARVKLIEEGPHSFRMTFSDGDPERAAGVINRVVDDFIQRSESKRQMRAGEVVARIEEEVRGVQEELDNHQARLEQYKGRTGARIPESLDRLISRLNQATSDLRQLERTIATAEAERTGYLAEIRILDEQGYNLAPTTPAEDDARRRDLERQLAAARDRWADSHPTVMRLQAELAALDPEGADPAISAADLANARARQRQLSANVARIDTQLGFYQEQRDQLVEEANGYQRQIDSIPSQDAELTTLIRDAETARSNYIERLQRLQQARLDARLAPADDIVGFGIAETARVPEMKSAPQRSRIVALGGLLGVFLGVGMVLVRQQLDSTFNDVDELRRFSGLPTLAAIPQVSKGWFRRRDESVIPTIEDKVSVISEQYRILTSRIQKMIDRECAQIVLVTSSAGNEGKTTTAINTAVALSQIQPGKVLLIDADLRKPQVREMLRAAHDGPLGPDEGFQQLLNGRNGLGQECFGRVGKLYLLASDEGSPDSLGDVTSEAVRTSLARLRKQFKYIVIDAPPLLPMVDSHLLSELADRVILIVRANQTRRETVSRMLNSFDMSKVLGFVMNGVNYSQARYGPAYDYYAKEYLKPPKRTWPAAKLRILL